MASGIAYRCTNLHQNVLHLYLDSRNYEPIGKPYKAPSKKASKTYQRPNLLNSRLPLEIAHLILLNLDLASLGMLSRVDRGSKNVVRSLPAYSLLKEHAPNTLRLIFATGISSHLPIKWIFTEFCQPRCRTCGEFGPYLYLPTVTRTCYKCAFLKPEYQVAPVKDVCLHFGVTEKGIKSLPIIHNVSQPRHRLVAIPEAKELGINLHGSYKAMERVSQKRRKELEEDYRRRVQEWKQEQSRGNSAPRPRRQRIPAKLGQDEYMGQWNMYATAEFPYWNCQTQKLQPGTFRRACTYHWEELKATDWRCMETIFNPHPPSREAYYRAFMECDLPEHFLHCAAVKANYNFRDAKRGHDKREGTDFVIKVMKKKKVTFG